MKEVSESAALPADGGLAVVLPLMRLAAARAMGVNPAASQRWPDVAIEDGPVTPARFVDGHAFSTDRRSLDVSWTLGRRPTPTVGGSLVLLPLR